MTPDAAYIEVGTHVFGYRLAEEPDGHLVVVLWVERGPALTPDQSARLVEALAAGLAEIGPVTVLRVGGPG